MGLGWGALFVRGSFLSLHMTCAPVRPLCGCRCWPKTVLMLGASWCLSPVPRPIYTYTTAHTHPPPGAAAAADGKKHTPMMKADYALSSFGCTPSTYCVQNRAVGSGLRGPRALRPASSAGSKVKQTHASGGPGAPWSFPALPFQQAQLPQA